MAGNVGTCTFVVIVEDTINPVVTCPANITVENEYGNTTAVVVFDGEAAIDNAGHQLSVTCDPPSNSTFTYGDSVVTCSATDLAGNVGSCRFTVTVEDMSSPIVTCPENITVEYDYGNTTAVVVFDGESATDNSGQHVSVTCDPSSNSTFVSGDNVVTCSATDQAGNVGTCNFVVKVQDTTSPVLTCPADITVEIDYGNTTAVVVYSGQSAVDNSGQELAVTCDIPSSSTFVFDDTLVTCSATDMAGNTGQCNFTVTVQDTTKPVVTCPSNVTVENDDGFTTAVVVFDGASVTDNSGHELSATCSPASNSTFASEDTTVTCSATDMSGNVGSCTFVVTVEDIVDPVVTCPSDITVEIDFGNTTAVVAYDGESATDNSGYQPPVTCDTPSNSTFALGPTIVTCSATDQAGNTGTCDFTVTVEDTTDPVVACPSDMTVEYDYGGTTAVVNYAVSATDNSGSSPAVACTTSPGSTLSSGDTNVTCYATDASGNSGSCTFKITVQDTTDPVVNCPASRVVDYDYGNTTAFVVFGGESATDNSGEDMSVSCDPPTNTTFESGPNVVTCSATDAAGNEGTCNFVVTVQDTADPLVTCPANVTAEYDYGNTTAVVVFDGESAVDNSGHTLSVTCDPPSNSTFAGDRTIVTCSATDRSGNTGTCSFVVNVRDTTDPVVTCPADQIVEYDDGGTTAVVTFSGSATDNSGSTSAVTCSPASGTAFSSGTTDVTCSATDQSGNQGTCTFSVTVQDTTDPVVTCPADTTVEYDDGGTTAVVTFSGESATDNSGTTPTVTCSPASGTVFADGETTVTCTATDAASNEGSCTFTVTVEDTTDPVVTCPADQTVEYDDGGTTAVVVYSGESATDNSGTAPSVTCDITSGTAFSSGSNDVTCSATDASGNVGSCTFTVVVQDTTDPVVTCPADQTVEYDDGGTTAVVTFSGSATDNSGTNPSVSCTPSSGSTFASGDATVTCSATDASGNTGSCTFSVTVQDTTEPVVTCPADLSHQLTAGETNARLTFSGESATDNSGITPSVTCVPASGTVFSVGETEVTCSASDVAGNTGTCTFTVYVNDVGDCTQNGACEQICLYNSGVYSCACRDGYTLDGDGRNCTEINECDPDPCVHGTCTDEVNDYSCACDAGYSGKNCSININDCRNSPCRNGGTCVDGVDSFTCNCLPGYRGNTCNRGTGQCILNCYRGTCVVIDGEQQCECNDGYKVNPNVNNYCVADVDECYNSTTNGCSHTCENSYGSFTCTCPNGYELQADDKTCVETDACESSPCVNGHCVDTIDGYTCDCYDGYEGTNCESETDECNPDQCVYGNCTDLLNRFECSCEDGYEGTLCDQDTDECASQPCKNGGTCTDLIASYSCQCDRGWTGQNCADDVDECADIALNDCHHNCTNTDRDSEDRGYICSCLDGYVLAGDSLSCEDIDECASEPCQNNATCVNDVDEYRCLCEDGWQGVNCDSDIDECASDDDNDCDDNASCSNNIGGYTCSCNTGYRGDGFTCREIILLPFGDNVGDSRLRDTHDVGSSRLYTDIVSETIRPPTGFPFGSYFYYSLYFTDNGQIIFIKENDDKYPYPHPNANGFQSNVGVAMVAAFWEDVDMTDSSVGEVFYQVYDDQAADKETFAEINSRIRSSSTSGQPGSTFNATWALKVTWSQVADFNVTFTQDSPNTFQAVIATDGVHSFAILNYREDDMLWNYETRRENNVIYGYNGGSGDPGWVENLQDQLSSLSARYRPDLQVGNTGLQGRWIVRLENNTASTVNYKQECLSWYEDAG
ncbi:hyalin-like [Ptychodera flava]|uniref:hyalin-like n=1 Tax=Ptychodera flava TaxID=63121 RepID=UPI00396A5B93